MLPLSTYLIRQGRRPAFVLPAALGLALLGSSFAVQAKPIPSNLGNGLDKLVASKLALAEANKTGAQLAGLVTVNGQTYTDADTAAIAASSLGDDSGRVLVRVNLNSDAKFKAIKKALKASASTLSITAVDKAYKGAGVLNAYVDAAEVPALARVRGVTSVILEWKPQTRKSVLSQALAPAEPGAAVGETITKVGTTFDQGVTQHRVDQISKFFNPALTTTNATDLPGQGLQIACISNSFAANAANPASVDVTNGDLPGSGSATQTTPVFILQDDLSSSTSDDEGRGMCQIVYKMAPYARVGFANNIRGLAGINSSTFPTASSQGFAADVICDDVGYFDEPFFQDGIIGAGVDDAAAAGVAYFSSAANDIGTNGYDSDARWVANGSGLTAAAGNAALAGTNIDLTNVPPALYAGGFHNFNPKGLDVAQTVNIAANNTVNTVFQWNDPYDQNTSVAVTGTLFNGGGTFTTAPVNFTVSGTVTAGTNYQVIETATNNSGFDGIVTVYKSDGTTVISGPQDTGTDEVVRFTAPANDTGFVVVVDHFATTTGTFSLVVQSFKGFTTPGPTTSLSILAFNVTTGAYVPASSLTADATATNEPLQLGFTNRTSAAVPQIQFVIARSVVPTAGFNFPTHLRYLLPGNGRGGYGPAEYFTYNTVTTGGHAMANGCNGTAAYSVFRPSLPETFTSPGPVTIYYDKTDQRLATPEVRLQPRIAAADGANISANESAAGLGSDSAADPDSTQGNFFGTSAAAPHAAAVALLVLQNKGGRGKVTPTQMTSLLERSTFPHDLDPNFSSGAARVTGGATGTGKVAITISSDGSAASATGLTSTGANDTSAFTVSYVGGSSITSLVFNAGGTTANGGVSGGNNGVTYNAPEATVGGTTTYFENSLPGVVFLPGTKAFTLNPTVNTSTINNANADSVVGATAAGANPNGANATQYLTLNVTVPTGNFTSAQKLRFTVGRGLAFAPTTGSTYNAVTNATGAAAINSADIFGGGVSLPNGAVSTVGMPFSGTTADGGTFSGVIRNNIGSGWATQDGYGFINAQTAVNQSVQ